VLIADRQVNGIGLVATKSGRPFILPPNPADAFERTGLSSDLCRVRDGVRVDVVMARRADD
jgi:hypothetical protein